MEKLKSGKIKIISRQGRSTIVGGTAPKRFSFFRFSSSAPSRIPSEASKVFPKEPLLKGTHLSKTSGKLAAIEKWVDLEEKIVHEYKNRKAIPARPMSPVNIPSTVSYAPGKSSLKAASSGVSRFLPRRGEIFLVLGWTLAGLFMALYVREVPLKQEASLQMTQALHEKGRLERSYAELKQSYSEIQAVSDERRANLQKLNGRIQTMGAEVQAFRKQAAAADLLGKTYREEVMRITTDYEVRLNSLQELLRNRDEIIASLRVQIQAVERMIDQGSLAAVSGVASRLAQPRASSGGASFFSEGNRFSQGTVTAVNSSQGFLIMDIGSEHGARTGGKIKIYRDGFLVGEGSADRVYPTMSSVTLSGRTAPHGIRKGDLVSL